MITLQIQAKPTERLTSYALQANYLFPHEYMILRQLKSCYNSPLYVRVLFASLKQKNKMNSTPHRNNVYLSTFISPDINHRTNSDFHLLLSMQKAVSKQQQMLKIMRGESNGLTSYFQMEQEHNIPMEVNVGLNLYQKSASDLPFEVDSESSQIFPLNDLQPLSPALSDHQKQLMNNETLNNSEYESYFTLS